MKTKPKTIETFLTAEERVVLERYLSEMGLDMKSWHRKTVRKAIQRIKREFLREIEEESKVIEQRAKRERMIEEAFK